MKAVPASELRGFHDFIAELLKNGSADLLPEEALDEWRQRHPDPLDFEDDVAAIQAALDEVDRGEGLMSLEQFDRELRTEFNLPDRPTP